MNEELRHKLVSMTYRDEVVSCEMTREELISIEDELEEKDKEIERLNSIISELEKWLDKEKNELKFEDNYNDAFVLEIVEEKLQELKGEYLSKSTMNYLAKKTIEKMEQENKFIKELLEENN